MVHFALINIGSTCKIRGGGGASISDPTFLKTFNAL